MRRQNQAAVLALLALGTETVDGQNEEVQEEEGAETVSGQNEDVQEEEGEGVENEEGEN